MTKPIIDPIVEQSVNFLRDRSRMGITKYGTTLGRSDLVFGDWLKHLLEELGDALNYGMRIASDLPNWTNVVDFKEPGAYWATDGEKLVLLDIQDKEDIPDDITFICPEQDINKWILFSLKNDKKDQKD